MATPTVHPLYQRDSIGISENRNDPLSCIFSL